MHLVRMGSTLAASAALVAGSLAMAPQTAHAAPRATSTPDPFSVTVTATGTQDGVLTTRDLLTGATRTYPNAGTVAGPRISPDGSSVVYASYPAGSDYPDLDLIDLASGTVTVLVGRQTGVSLSRPTFTPDGGSIAYTVTTDAGSEIDEISSSDGAVSPLQTAAADPAFRPDGTLVFVPTDSTDADPCLLATSGGCVVTQSDSDAALGLAGGTAVSLVPTGSAGGIAVLATALAGSDQQFTELGTVDAYGDTIGFFGLTKTTYTDLSKLGDPVLSQTGTELYFLSDVSGTPSVQALDTLTGRQVATVSKTEYVADLDVFGVVTSPYPASLYQPVKPTRVFDTRPGKAPVLAGSPVDIPIAGTHGVPDDATAVVLNLTGISPSAATVLKLYPTPADGSAVPTVSNLNLAAKQTSANAVTVTLGDGGAVRLANDKGSTNAAVDLLGYYEPSSADATATSTFFPLDPPKRVLDTRTTTGGHKGPLPAGGHLDLSLPNLPDGTTSVVLNLLGTGGTAPTFLSAYPTSGATPPSTSTLNLSKGETRANLATVPIGADRVVRIYNAAGSEQVIADVAGYYASSPSGDLFVPVDPTRIFDTRNGTQTVGGVAGPIGQGATADGPALGTITTAYGQVDLPGTVAALQVNLTAVGATAPTFLSLYAADVSGTPTFSTLNVPPNTAIPNAAITARSNDGEFRVYNAKGSTQAIVDIAGYFEVNSD